MNKRMKIILLAIIITVSTTASANAATGMTAIELRAEIDRLTKVADNIRAKLAGLGVSTSECLETNLRMRRGDSGESVTRLQLFLAKSGVYSHTLVTGYFGPATEAGVQRWQAGNGVVGYGTPNTTGYGLVGPSTLRAMHTGCPNGVYVGDSGSLNKTMGTEVPVTKPTEVIIEKYSLSLNPTKGLAPLAVTASFTIKGSTCTSYILNWGDGSSPVSYDSGKDSNCSTLPINITRSHVYNTHGSYEVLFKTGKAPLSKIKTVNLVKIESLKTF